MKNEKIELLRDILSGKKDEYVNKSNDVIHNFKNLDFKEIPLNSDSNDSIVFSSINEVVNTFESLHINLERNELINELNKRISNPKKEFRLLFF